MVYIPRLYNPNPLIVSQLYFIGHRVKKIDDEWIYIYPRGWKELSASYDNAKGLNIKNMEVVPMEEHQIGETVQFNKYMDKGTTEKKDESLNTESEEK